jgi:glycosyltransferase involved in cell wall biosynthesis
MQEKSPTISLCMIAKNESALIAQAIQSVLPIVTEVILVDTGSSDNTVDIAKSLGVKVLHRAWDNDFSAPRNLSIENASSDWILVLDADEAIDSSDLQRIQELTLHPNKCYKLTQRHYTNDPRLSDFTPVKGEFPKWEKNYGGYFDSSLVRLFPNHSELRYEGRVHELVDYAAIRNKKYQTVESRILIHHYGHTPEVKSKKKKSEIYTNLGQAKTNENPNDWKSFFELGVEHNNNGRLNESAHAFKEAGRLNPNYLSTWLNLGYVQCELQQYKDAVESLQKAINLDNKCAEAYCNLGVIYLRINQLVYAEKYFSIAIHLQPKYINAYCNLGKTLCGMQRFSESVHIYLRALEIMPKCSTAKLDLGTIYLSHKMYKHAESFLKEAFEEMPHEPLAALNLGQLYKILNKNKEAIKALERFQDNIKGSNNNLNVQSILEASKIECWMLSN